MFGCVGDQKSRYRPTRLEIWTEKEKSSECGNMQSESSSNSITGKVVVEVEWGRAELSVESPTWMSLLATRHKNAYDLSTLTEKHFLR